MTNIHIHRIYDGDTEFQKHHQQSIQVTLRIYSVSRMLPLLTGNPPSVIYT